ncbi:MAG: peptidylprolyl isomerase [Deltaproteobacteria bacterium]|nr:peptidylprolyl isomerase [Deltaproteobacteria bacterium]
MRQVLAALLLLSLILSLPACSGSVTDGYVLLTGTNEVVLETSLGDISLVIDAVAAPKAVTNFMMLTRDGYYDGVTFHRVIDGFMIQGGDPTATGSGGESAYGGDFEDEDNSIRMERGVLAMANAGSDTNGSQFFIIQAEAGTPHLQGRHTAFGRVIEGMHVVDAIARVETDERDRPVTSVTMNAREL